MADYDVFAKFYDQTMGDRSVTVKFLRALINEHNPEASRVLELACGTGEMMLGLSDRYEVNGLEISEGMLRLAKKKLPMSNFYEQSMAGFDLPDKYDVIYCVFDSINHLLHFSDWKKVFRSASRHLEKGGIFIFDMNTEKKLREVTEWPEGRYRCGENEAVIKIRSAGRGMACWNIKIYEKLNNGKLKLHEENICEKSFPTDKVKAELVKHYGKVKMMRRVERIADIGDRIYFFCRKG